MNSKVELLSPAGDFDSFLAAVENEADAVYLGAKNFSARQNASNFEGEELRKALDYAHARDVSVYLAINTLISDNEMKDALNIVKEAYKDGIDALIVQDIGFARLVHKYLPGLDLHASTQMTVYNIDGVKMLEELGFKRVVLARELSLEEIRSITAATSLDVEIFIHGALCVSYSGQCLLSSILGQRSGNRGKCAQPCRLPYEVIDRSTGESKGSRGYIMSPKDLCSLEMLGEITSSGVKSLKIEGRMKTPEYVAAVVRIYRKYLDSLPDGKIQEADIKEILQIFNRGGLSKGYLLGKKNQDFISFEKPKNWGLYLGKVITADKGYLKIKLCDSISTGDGIEVWNGEDESPGTIVSFISTNGQAVKTASAGQTVSIGTVNGRIKPNDKVYKTSDKALNLRGRETFSGKGQKKAAVYGVLEVQKGLPASLEIRDENGFEVKVTGKVSAETALKTPLTVDRVKDQITKTGDTPFLFKNIDINLAREISLPISELNSLRREALFMLEQKKLSSYKRALPEESLSDLNLPQVGGKKSKQAAISVLFYKIEELQPENLPVERVYLPFKYTISEKGIKTISKCKEKGIEVFSWVPSVTRGRMDSFLKEKLENVLRVGLDGILAGNLGTLNLLSAFPSLKKAANFTLNAFNSFSLSEYSLMGLGSVTLSVEMTLSQISSINRKGGLDIEILAYGSIPLMTSEHCPSGYISECKGCTKGSETCKTDRFALRDRKGIEFPIYTDSTDFRSTIFNSNVLFTGELTGKIASCADILRLDITEESQEDVENLVALYRDLTHNTEGALRKHEALVRRIKEKGHTKGHFLRGV